MQTRLKQAIAQSQGLKTIITNNDQLNRSFRLLTCEFSSDNVKLMPMYILNKHCGKKLIKKGTKYSNTFTDKNKALTGLNIIYVQYVMLLAILANSKLSKNSL